MVFAGWLAAGSDGIDPARKVMDVRVMKQIKDSTKSGRSSATVALRCDTGGSGTNNSSSGPAMGINAPQQACVPSALPGTWTRYIDSRLKQFSSR
jgi:hypothetical protein